MSRARETARLISNDTFRVDSNNAVGFGSTTPDAMFDINAGLTVAGIVTTSGLHAVVGTNWDSTNYSFVFENQETQNLYGNSVQIIGGGGAGGGHSSSNTLAVGDNDGNIDFVVRGDGRVGIGTDDPDGDVHAFGTIKLEGSVEITPTNNPGVEGGHITLRNPDKSTTGAEIDVSAANAFRIFQLNNNSVMEMGQLNGTGGTILFKTQAAERLKIHATGSVTKPTNPLIKTVSGDIYGSASSLTASPNPPSAILQSAAEIDKGDNGWTTSGSNAYTYVCPVAGVYAVHAHASLGDITQGNRVIWSIGYTDGGGNLPLASYVEVMDVNVDDFMNYSYYNTFSFSAGTRIGFGLNGISGQQSGFGAQWGIHLLQ